MSSVKDYFAADASEISSFVQEIRRHIHKHPEPDADQPATVEYLAQKFVGMPDVTMRYGEGCVGLVVDIHGAESGPIIGLRADTDALYMQETDAPEHLPNKQGFCSTVEGVAHMCGHDAHCAMLAGAGHIIHKHRKFLKGTVRLLFQPGEEGFDGARRMVEAGYLKDVTQVYALHCMPTYKTGQIAFRKGGITSAIDFFKVTVSGIGGHGSAPEKASDQVLAASQMISNLQNIVARRVGPLENAVVSVCYVKAGDLVARTVMPASAEFAGSIRTFDPVLRDKIKDIFFETCEHTAKAIHTECKVDIEYKALYPATINNAQLVDNLENALSPWIDKENLLSDCEPLLGSEDFSVMANNSPGVFMMLGVCPPDADIKKFPYVHNPAFDLDENALSFGARVFANIVFSSVAD